MPEVILATTAAPTEGFAPTAMPGRVFTIAGTGAIWSDADDATYAHVNAGTPASLTNRIAAEAPLEALSLPPGATVTGVGVRFRYKATQTDAGTTFFGVRLKSASGNDPGVLPALLLVAGSSFGSIEAPADTAIHDVDYLITEADYTDNLVSLETLAGWLMAGGWVWFEDYTNPTTNTTSQLWVYEAEVYVTYELTITPPLRQHPRSDGLGTSSARRVTGSRSVQGSIRRAGGYL